MKPNDDLNPIPEPIPGPRPDPVPKPNPIPEPAPGPILTPQPAPNLPPKPSIANHIHIPADPLRQKSEQIKARQQERESKGKPADVTNDMIYEMLMDILEKQDVLESFLKNKTTLPSGLKIKS